MLKSNSKDIALTRSLKFDSDQLSQTKIRNREKHNNLFFINKKTKSYGKGSDDIDIYITLGVLVIE